MDKSAYATSTTSPGARGRRARPLVAVAVLATVLSVTPGDAAGAGGAFGVGTCTVDVGCTATWEATAATGRVRLAASPSGLGAGYGGALVAAGFEYRVTVPPDTQWLAVHATIRVHSARVRVSDGAVRSPAGGTRVAAVSAGLLNEDPGCVEPPKWWCFNWPIRSIVSTDGGHAGNADVTIRDRTIGFSTHMYGPFSGTVPIWVWVTARAHQTHKHAGPCPLCVSPYVPDTGTVDATLHATIEGLRIYEAMG